MNLHSTMCVQRRLNGHKITPPHRVRNTLTIDTQPNLQIESPKRIGETKTKRLTDR